MLNLLKRNKVNFMKLLAFTLFSTLLTLTSNSQAELQVFPLRATLTDKERSTQISLRHKGNKAERYRIKTIFYKMGEDGSMKEMENPTPEDKDASKYFRYSPRQVVLEPNIEQVVRIMARVPADLPEGEYRCHLHFEAMNDDTAAPTEGQGQMQLKARLAVAIPIIVKKGNTSVKVALSKFKILKDKQNKYSLSVNISKEGNGFAYGNVEIIATSDKGEATSIATINGISSYIPHRNLTMPMQINSLPPGKIKILFKDPTGTGEQVIAQTELESVP